MQTDGQDQASKSVRDRLRLLVQQQSWHASVNCELSAAQNFMHFLHYAYTVNSARDQLIMHVAESARSFVQCMHKHLYLAGGAVRDVSTVPKAVHTDLLELGSRGVGVKPFP